LFRVETAADYGEGLDHLRPSSRRAVGTTSFRRRSNQFWRRLGG
jgi:hypothetical protein